jgi:hypothetical protein
VTFSVQLCLISKFLTSLDIGDILFVVMFNIQVPDIPGYQLYPLYSYV